MFLPRMYDILDNACKNTDNEGYNDTISEAYEQIEAISIDYGIMEKSTDIVVV